MPPTQQMHMQMFHRLPSIRPGIHNQPIPTPQPLLPRNLHGSRHQPTQQRLIPRLRLRQRPDMPLRNHQNMHRRLRMNIRKRHHLLILIQARHRNRTGGDLAKKAI